MEIQDKTNRPVSGAPGKKRGIECRGRQCLQERKQDQVLLQIRNRTRHRLNIEIVLVPSPSGEGLTDTP
jgi:hypothetical protein